MKFWTQAMLRLPCISKKNLTINMSPQFLYYTSTGTGNGALAVLIIGFILILLIIFIVIYYTIKIITSQTGKKFTGAESIINKIGIARTAIEANSKGTVTLDGISWEAVNLGAEKIEKSDNIIVMGRKGVSLQVKKFNKKILR